MKKIIAMLLAAMMLLSATAIAEIDISGLSLDELKALQSQIALTIADKTGNGVISNGTVLMDNEYCKVTFTGLDFEWNIPALKVTIENKSDKTLGVTPDQMVINGWSVYGFGVTDIAPNSKVMGTLESGTMEEEGVLGVEDIAETRLVLRVYDCDTYDTLLTDEEITLTFGE